MTDAREVIARANYRFEKSRRAISNVITSFDRITDARKERWYLGAGAVLVALRAAGLAIAPKDTADQLAAAEARIEELESALTMIRQHHASDPMSIAFGIAKAALKDKGGEDG